MSVYDARRFGSCLRREREAEGTTQEGLDALRINAGVLLGGSS